VDKKDIIDLLCSALFPKMLHSILQTVQKILFSHLCKTVAIIIAGDSRSIVNQPKEQRLKSIGT